MIKRICLMMILSFAGFAFSNDTPLVMGRNDEIINVRSASIAMREEVINITLRRDHYEVDVSFDFYNDGLEENIQLGFPVSYGRYPARADEKIYDFQSYINGTPVKHISQIDSTSETFPDGGKDHLEWFIRNVTFPANSRTISRVTYKAPYGRHGGPVAAGYIYGTGSFWNGGIGKMTVIVSHDDDVLIDKIDFGESIGGVTATKAFLWDANGRYRYVFENIKPQNKHESVILFVQLFEDGLYGKYSNQFGRRPDNMRGNHIEEMYDEWVWNKYLLYKDTAEIQLYTRNQIRLHINFFFAMRGYDFKNLLYKEYFQRIEHFHDQNNTAYQVNPNFRERDFNEFERKNIDYLLNLEKMIPK